MRSSNFMGGSAGEPFREIVRFVAERTGLSEEQALIALTYFVEGLATQVAKNHCVRVPGLGMFAPWLWEPGPKNKVGMPHCIPRFSACRPFRKEVELTCPNDPTGRERLSRYATRQAPGSKGRKDSATVFTTMDKIRREIENQARTAGHDPLASSRPPRKADGLMGWARGEV